MDWISILTYMHIMIGVLCTLITIIVYIDDNDGSMAVGALIWSWLPLMNLILLYHIVGFILTPSNGKKSYHGLD